MMNTNSKILNNILEHHLGTGEFGRFRDYLELIESHLEREKENHEKSYDEEKFEEYAKSAGEHHREYLAFLINEYYKEKKRIVFDFPHSFRSALVIQLFSFLEFELKNICDYHASSKDSDFSVNDLKGNSEIEKAKRYLSKAAKIDFNIFNPEWSYINNVRIVRNLLVHHQGTITPKHPEFSKVEQFVKGNNLILQKRGNQQIDSIYDIAIPDRRMPESVILNFEQFIDKLLKELKF